MRKEMVALARLLDDAKERISTTIVEADLQRRPELVVRYGSDVHRVYRRDNDHHLDFLDQALAARQPALFSDYVSWAKALLGSHGVRAEDLLINLQLLRDAVRTLLPGDHLPTIEAYIDAGIAVLPQAPDEPASFMPVAPRPPSPLHI